MIIPIDVPMLEQCIQFVYALLIGIFFGILYVVLRSFGRRAVAFLWDAVFVIISLSVGTIFFMTICNGYPRAFHLLGLALGAVLIFLLIGRVKNARRSKRSTHEKEKTSSHT